MALPKELARDILPLANSDAFDMLKQYVDYRVAQVHKELESVTPEGLKLLQGALNELRLLQQLRERVQADSK